MALERSVRVMPLGERRENSRTTVSDRLKLRDNLAMEPHVLGAHIKRMSGVMLACLTWYHYAFSEDKDTM